MANSIIDNQQDVKDFSLQCFPPTKVEIEDAKGSLWFKGLDYSLWYSTKESKIPVKSFSDYTEQEINNEVLNLRKLRYEQQR